MHIYFPHTLIFFVFWQEFTKRYCNVSVNFETKALWIPYIYRINFSFKEREDLYDVLSIIVKEGKRQRKSERQ